MSLLGDKWASKAAEEAGDYVRENRKLVQLLRDVAVMVNNPDNPYDVAEFIEEELRKLGHDL